ncbi:hypothetical protein CEXT_123811, partial [Caerostris extrusa]
MTTTLKILEMRVSFPNFPVFAFKMFCLANDLLSAISISVTISEAMTKLDNLLIQAFSTR